jgi:hypothetical protein
MSISVNSVRVHRLQRVGDAGDRAGEGAIGEFRHAHDRANARLHAKGGVLRHVDPDADGVLLH